MSSLFIFSNSISGPAGWMLARRSMGLMLPHSSGWMVLTVLVFGAIGSRLGSRDGSVVWIRRVLAGVLVMAAWTLLAL